MPDRPVPGQLEERSEPISTDGQRIRGVIPFSVESRDMGGWTEVIEPGALRGADLSELVATVEHTGVPIGRHPGTLSLEERSDGVHWSVDPPASRQDVVEAIQRGDLRAGSWRMKVARDSWQGDVRHVHEIAALRDVAVTSSPAYPDAAVELRSQPEEAHVPTETATEATQTETLPETHEDATEARGTPGSLRVEDRNAATPRRGLADEFRARGWPGEIASIPWEEYEQRAVVWSASVDLLNQARVQGGPLGFDTRYAWPAFPRVGVGSDVTSVAVVSQTGRTLAAPTDTVRAIDETSPKPEVASTLDISPVSLRQVAAIESNIPNVYLAQAVVNSIIETDLRLSINEGLDSLVTAAVAGAAHQAPGTDALLVSIRKAITTLQAEGYSPDVLILDPASDAALDTLVSGISGGVNDFVFSAGGFAPGTIFGLSRRVSKTLPAPVVVDASAFGRLYSGPVSLARGSRPTSAPRTAATSGWSSTPSSASSGSTPPSGSPRRDPAEEEAAGESQARARGPGGAHARPAVREGRGRSQPGRTAPLPGSPRPVMAGTSDIVPTVDEVASLIAVRTIDSGGDEPRRVHQRHAPHRRADAEPGAHRRR